MKSYLIALAIFCFYLLSLPTLKAQTSHELDSLTSALNQAIDDTTKSNVLLDLSKLHWYSDKTKAEAYAQQALELGKSTGNKSQVALAYNSLGVIQLFRGNYDEALVHFKRALDIQKFLLDFKRIANLHNNMAVVYDKLGNYDAALKQHQLALDQRKELMDEAGVSDSYNNIANVYRKQGHYAKALDFYIQSLEIDERLGRDDIAIGNVYNNIGIMYHLMDDEEIALNHYHTALEKFRNAKVQSGEAMVLVNMSVSYKIKGRFDEALKAAKRALTIADNIREKARIAEAYNSIGDILMLQDKALEAISSFRQALRLYSEIHNSSGIIETLIKLASLHQKTQEWQKALNYALGAQDSAKRIGYMSGLIDASERLYMICQQMGDYRQAFNYQHQYTILKDSLFKMSQSKEILALQNKFENKQKTHELELLKAKQSSQEKLLEHQKNRTYILTIGLAVFFVLAFFLYQNQKRLRDTIHLLQLKNTEVSTQKDEIEDQHLELQQIQEQLKNQHDFIENRNRELTNLNEELSDKNIRITDNIVYAKRVQNAVLPKRTELKRYFEEVSIIYLPKDIVSGDFYWMTQNEHQTFFALADGTGHGVSGAFMSLLGSTFLDEVVNVKSIYEPVDILNDLDAKVTQKLHTGPKMDSDGLELALCRFEDIGKREVKVCFSGARSNFYYYLPDSGQLNQLDGTRKGIGGIFQSASKSFVQHEVILPKGTLVYLFTDGLPDYPNAKGRRLGTRKILKFIERHAPLAPDLQTEMVQSILDRYKRKIKQRDDISFVILKL